MIGLRERVVFVVVALAATQRLAEERGTRRVGEVGHQLVAVLGVLLKDLARTVIGAESQEAGREEGVHFGFVRRTLRVGQQLVSRQLLDDKLIERFVGVERANHVIAEPPHRRAKLIPLEAVRVGVPHHIEPPPRLTDSILGVSEQAINQPLEGIRRGIAFKLSDLVGSRRQPDQIERHAPQERPTIGLRRGNKVVRNQAGDDEGIHR